MARQPRERSYANKVANQRLVNIWKEAARENPFLIHIRDTDIEKCRRQATRLRFELYTTRSILKDQLDPLYETIKLFSITKIYKPGDVTLSIAPSGDFIEEVLNNAGIIDKAKETEDLDDFFDQQLKEQDKK